jgi:hypothetical protein
MEPSHRRPDDRQTGVAADPGHRVELATRSATGHPVLGFPGHGRLAEECGRSGNSIGMVRHNSIGWHRRERRHAGGLPVEGATGVANTFVDPDHMKLPDRVVRDGARFLRPDQTMAKSRLTRRHASPGRASKASLSWTASRSSRSRFSGVHTSPMQLASLQGRVRPFPPPPPVSRSGRA